MALKELKSPSNRILLVTSAFHLYQAKKLFEKKGLIVTTYKVNYKTALNSRITVMNFLPSTGSLGMTESGMREMIGRLYHYN